jgi:hypothetical protein
VSTADPVELPGEFPFPSPDVGDDRPFVPEPLPPGLDLVSELPGVVHWYVAVTNSPVAMSALAQQSVEHTTRTAPYFTAQH